MYRTLKCVWNLAVIFWFFENIELTFLYKNFDLIFCTKYWGIIAIDIKNNTYTN